MRKLVLFVYKNHLLFLFLFLQSVSVLLLIQNNNYQRTSFISSSNAISGNALAAYTNITSYLDLRATNEVIATENADLRNRLKSSFTNYTSKNTVVSDSVYKQQYIYITAKVVNNSVTRRNNYLTLNRGALQGVKPQMAVISSTGVIGIVKNVSDNFCTVMSVLHGNVKVPVMIKRYGENAILNWEGTDFKTGNVPNVPSHLKLIKGDTLVTSAYSSIFPQGIMVGTINDIAVVQGNTFNNLKINFSTDFRKVAYVYIVNNLLKDEQQSLEDKTQEEDAAANQK
jgi:rod shape-determining protein MreC